LRNHIDRLVFDKSPVTSVIAGKEDWLFLANAHSIDDYMGRPTLSAEDLAAWNSMLQDRHDRLAAQGIKYYFFIPPNKQSIYPEYMPSKIFHGRFHTVDRLLARMSRNGQPDWVIDPRTALLAAKGPTLLYRVMDVHWNEFGAYIGTVALTGALRHDGVAVSTPAIPNSQFVMTLAVPSGGLAKMIGIESKNRIMKAVEYTGPALGCGQANAGALVEQLSVLPDRTPDLVTDCPQAGNKTRALIFHDSMVEQMEPYLFAAFGHTRLVWMMPGRDDLLRYIDAEHPDVVIEERVEREMVKVPAPPQKLPTVRQVTVPAPTRLGGWVDLATPHPATLVLNGWAFWEPGNNPVLKISTNLPILSSRIALRDRPDVAGGEHDAALLHSGFTLWLTLDPAKPRPKDEALCVWSDDPRYGARRIEFVNHKDWNTCPGQHAAK
jgi:hypothetical protein